MNSSNIGHYPLNKQGALELGLNPCLYCCSGYSNYSKGAVSSCHASCEYLKIYSNKEKLEQIKLKGCEHV